MPRRKKCRKVCRMPPAQEFRPVGELPGGEAVILPVDEYEAIRLIDREGFSQSECSRYMQVARATVQLIYDAARKKLAHALVDGLPLRIEGGSYRLCDGTEESCGCGGCRRHRCGRMRPMKEEEKMRITIPLDENRQDVCVVLARSPYFLFRDGAGKTFVAVNLAAVAEHGCYVDCDVEEPNGRLFRKPERVRSTPCSVPVPEFDGEKCDGCRQCVEFCRFHALLYIRERPRVFAELCHGCGGCALLCPRGTVRETYREIGVLEEGERESIRVVSGILHPGEASGVPLIRQALERSRGLSIIDCPPGSACGVMESVKDADCCALVAEPTAFGFHNFRMVHELVSEPSGSGLSDLERLVRTAGTFQTKLAVCVNRYDVSPRHTAEIGDFCRERGLLFAGKIPFDPLAAAAANEGRSLVETDSPAARAVRQIYRTLRRALELDEGGADASPTQEKAPQL